MLIRRISFVFFTQVFVLFCISCAALQTQTAHYKSIEKNLRFRDYGRVVHNIEEARKKGKYGAKDRVLFYLDMGLALHFAKKYEKSNKYLDKAEIAIEENFTKSISKIMTSFLLNDNVLDYAGEDYEDVFTNVIKGLNYIHLGDYEAAMVEIRRVNLKLNRIQDKYAKMAKKLSESKKLKKDEKTFDFKPGKTKLQYSVFASYLSMIGYSNMGKWDDALIDKRRVIEGSSGRLRDLSKEVLEPAQDSLIPTYTLCFAGKGPIKEELVLLLDFDPDLNLARVMLPGLESEEITSFRYEGESELHLKFAVPRIERRNSNIKGVRTLVDGCLRDKMCLIENFGEVGEETFKVKKPIIYLRAALRTLLKAFIDAKAKEDIDKKHDKNKILAGFLKFAVDVATDITENADLRCWRTMPGTVYGGRIDLPPGEHTVTFEYLNAHGNVVDLEKRVITVNEKGLNIIEGVSYR